MVHDIRNNGKPGRKRRLPGCPFKPLLNGRTDLLPGFVKPRALRF